MVTGYTVDSLPAARDTARYVVHWRTIGSTTPEIDHMRFVPGTRADADTIGFVHTPYGWRLMGTEVSDPTMGAAAVLRQSHLDASSREALERSVHRSSQELLP